MPQAIKPATTYPAILGRILTLRRKEAGMQQEEMATAVGITQSTWSRIENGATSMTVSQLARAAAALRKQPSDLLAEADAAALNLRSRGMKVEIEPDDGGALGPGLAFLGGAALGALVLSVLSGKRR